MLVAAFGYASVGHGGASAYLAAMALAGVAPQEMRPVALLLNVLVSSLATWKFYRAGHFRWRLFWPFAVVSIPLAYAGGAITLPGQAYKILVGVVLLYAAWQLWRSGRAAGEMRLSCSSNDGSCAPRSSCISTQRRDEVTRISDAPA